MRDGLKVHIAEGAEVRGGVGLDAAVEVGGRQAGHRRAGEEGAGVAQQADVQVEGGGLARCHGAVEDQDGVLQGGARVDGEGH